MAWRAHNKCQIAISKSFAMENKNRENQNSCQITPAIREKCQLILPLLKRHEKS